MYHAVDRQAYHHSITVHTHGSVEVDPTIQVGLTTTPSLLDIRVSGEAGKAARASTSGDDRYYFAPAEQTWTRNWNRRRFCVFRGP